MASSNKVLRAVALLLRIALGAVFVYAAWVKIREPWELFALAVSSYKILPLPAVEFVARTLPWFEMIVGVMLIAGVWLRITATITSVLLVAFLGLIVRAYLLGMEISCGCFSNNEPITWLTMLRDGSMLAGSLILTAMAFGWPARKPGQA
jgi:cobalt-zinc-cadmium efflux system protein